MSIEMKHSERLTQSIDGLRASGIGCGTILAVPFLLLAATFLALSCAAIMRCTAMIRG